MMKKLAEVHAANEKEISDLEEEFLLVEAKLAGKRHEQRMIEQHMNMESSNGNKIGTSSMSAKFEQDFVKWQKKFEEQEVINKEVKSKLKELESSMVTPQQLRKVACTRGQEHSPVRVGETQ